MEYQNFEWVFKRPPGFFFSLLGRVVSNDFWLEGKLYTVVYPSKVDANWHLSPKKPRQSKRTNPPYRKVQNGGQLWQENLSGDLFLFRIFLVVLKPQKMGVSKNSGNPKLKWMIWGYHYFRKYPYHHRQIAFTEDLGLELAPLKAFRGGETETFTGKKHRIFLGGK